MKELFSRYGGSIFIIGKGRAGNEKLPKDQSLDNLLDNYALEITKNIFYISSHDALPEFMGGYLKLPPRTFKVGTIDHDFYDVMMQYNPVVSSDIYIGIHQYSNVFSVFIKTNENDMKSLFDDYNSTYDYVLTVFFKGVTDEEDDLKKNPILMEKLLLILFYKMELDSGLHEFKPSKTFLGKRVSSSFIKKIKDITSSISDENELKKCLDQWPF